MARMDHKLEAKGQQYEGSLQDAGRSHEKVNQLARQQKGK